MTQDAKKDLAAKAFSDERHGNRDYTRRLQVLMANFYTSDDYSALSRSFEQPCKVYIS
jgi:hypothetical protein